MISIVSKTRYALYDGDKCITEFEWNSLKEANGFVVLYNEDTLVIFDKSNGKKVLHIDDFQDVKFEDNHLYIQKWDKWGVFEYSGKEIVPIRYDHINECIYSLTTKELMAVSVDGGYYIVPIKTFYMADDINITKTNKIELLKKGEWSMLE